MSCVILMNQVHFHGKSFALDMVLAWCMKVTLTKFVFPIIQVDPASRDMRNLNRMAIVHFMELRGLVMEDQLLLMFSVVGHGDVDRRLTVAGFAPHVFLREHAPMPGALHA
jgi:hypothetical protein